MKSQSTENYHSQCARRLKRRIAVFCVAIMAAICVLVTKGVVRDHNAALDRARIEAANLSAGFEEQVRGTLNSIAGAMEFLKRRIEARGTSFNLGDWKNQIPQLVSPTINIFMIDAQGKLLATSAEHAPNPVYYSDRDYFQALRDNPDLGLFIAAPAIGKCTNRLILNAARRLETKDGQFAGVLVFSIAPELLTTLYQKVNPGKAASIRLFQRDGTALASYIAGKGLDMPPPGRKVKGIEALIDSKSADAGEYIKKAELDGVTRIFHWRKVKGYPLVVTVGLSEANALAAANHQAGIVIGLGLVALSLLLLMMLMLNREISRRAQQAIELDKINAELVLAHRRAEEASRAKSAFLANMSHELRTPLNAILGFSEMIRDRLFGRDLDRYAGFASDIHRSGAHLLDIVNDVLNVSKIEAGKLELQKEEVNVHTAVQESLLAVEQQAAGGGVCLTKLAPDIGASFFGDKTKLKQILINLLSNAIKFTPQGGAATITAAADEDGGMRLMIHDTGIGMSGEEIRVALELFRQVDNSHSRRFEGTGLGLPLAVRLTELHGGTLTIESTPGKGTTVTVRFPANRIIWDQDGEASKAGTIAPFKIAS
jgi:two-component system cell cycle sensor histidine kinase PleC